MKTRLSVILIIFGLCISYGQSKIKIKYKSNYTNNEMSVITNDFNKLKDFDWYKTMDFYNIQEEKKVTLSFTVKRPKKFNKILDDYSQLEKEEGISVDYKLDYSNKRENKVRKYTFTIHGKSSKVEELIGIIKSHIDHISST
jgi:hypothetical protein